MFRRVLVTGDRVGEYVTKVGRESESKSSQEDEKLGHKDKWDERGPYWQDRVTTNIQVERERHEECVEVDGNIISIDCSVDSEVTSIWHQQYYSCKVGDPSSSVCRSRIGLTPLSIVVTAFIWRSWQKLGLEQFCYWCDTREKQQSLRAVEHGERRGVELHL